MSSTCVSIVLRTLCKPSTSESEKRATAFRLNISVESDSVERNMASASRPLVRQAWTPTLMISESGFSFIDSFVALSIMMFVKAAKYASPFFSLFVASSTIKSQFMESTDIKCANSGGISFLFISALESRLSYSVLGLVVIRPSLSKIYNKDNSRKIQDIISEVKEGYYIRNVQGAHSSNPESGDFSIVGNPAILIKDGKMVGQVEGFMTSGNIYELLENDVEVAKTPLYLQATIAPEIVVQDVSVVAKE